jgi:hypothetical protein
MPPDELVPVVVDEAVLEAPPVPVVALVVPAPPPDDVLPVDAPPVPDIVPVVPDEVPPVPAELLGGALHPAATRPAKMKRRWWG